MKNYYHYAMMSVATGALIAGFAGQVLAKQDVPAPEKEKIIWESKVSPVSKSIENYGLVPHKARYNLQMVHNNAPTKVSDIQGIMTYNFVKTCQSWLTDQTLNLEMVQTDGIPMRSVNHFFSDERFDGSEYHYASDNVINKQPVDRSVGKVFGDKKHEHYYAYHQGMDKQAQRLDYPNLTFPVHHLTEILYQSKKGNPIYHASVFDGSFADEPVSINAVTSSHRNTVDDTLKSVFAKYKQYLSPSSWSISYAYFKNDGAADDSETSPDYESEVKMMENGIITELTIQYPDFILKGNLVGFEPLDKPRCR